MRFKEWRREGVVSGTIGHPLIQTTRCLPSSELFELSRKVERGASHAPLSRTWILFAWFGLPSICWPVRRSLCARTYSTSSTQRG